MASDQIITVIIQVIKAVGLIVPAVLNFFKDRKSDKDKKSSHND